MAYVSGISFEIFKKLQKKVELGTSCLSQIVGASLSGNKLFIFGYYRYELYIYIHICICESSALSGMSRSVVIQIDIERRGENKLPRLRSTRRLLYCELERSVHQYIVFNLSVVLSSEGCCSLFFFFRTWFTTVSKVGAVRIDLPTI